MTERSMIQVNIKDGSIIPVIPAEGKSGSYEEWLAYFFGSQEFSLVEEDRSQISLEALRRMAKDREYQEHVFTLRRRGTGRTWYEVRVLPGWEPEYCLLIVRDIHQEFRESAKKRRSDLYHMVRRKLAVFREQGILCGVMVIEPESGRHCFMDRRSKDFFARPVYQTMKEDLDNRLWGLWHGEGENCPADGVHAASDCFSMVSDDGTDCWISLFGYTMTMESGKRYMYLIWVGVLMSDGTLGFVKSGAGAGTEHNLTELVESYLFEWNIEDNQMTLADNWDGKFCAVGSGKNGFRKIERYIFKDDIPKVRKMFNLILSGDIEDNIMARFYIRDGETEKAEWCSISLISVLYDGKIPMYVVGTVRDLSSKLKVVMETSVNGRGISKEVAGRARLLAEHIISESPPGCRHALMAVGLNFLMKNDGNMGMEMVIYQYMELVTRMIYPDDIVWIDGNNMMLFLRDVGNGLNAKKKAERICRVLENSEYGEMTADSRIAMYPDDGKDFDSLMEQIKSDLSLNSMKVRRALSAMNSGNDGVNLYQSVNIIPDILDEWYRTIKTNNLLTEKMELTKAQLMLSQIKPHFIYNVLANIKSLIYTDADKAADIVVAFTKYLRVQLNSLSEDELAQFPEILDFVKNYIEIEKSRFPGKIHVQYDIRYDDFRLPHFVLQPIVENAIKHGICKRETSGKLIISSRLQDQVILIEVTDNGVGFDTKHKEVPGKEHSVGLENVRVRLHHLVRGEIQIESRLGVGTKVSIRIPK